MLKYYVKRSVGEDFQKVETPPKANVWVQGENVTETDLHHIAAQYQMNFNVLRDVLDKDELPRVEIQKDVVYVFLRTVVRGKHGQTVTSPALLTVKDSVFVSLSSDLANDGMISAPSFIAQTTDATGLLLGTFASVISEYEALMKQTARYIHDTSHRLRTHEVTNEDFIRFVTVEDNLNEYHMNLSGMLVIAQRLHEALEESGDMEAIEDILQYIRQLIVAINSYNQSITSIRNAYGTIANNVLNQRMKTLTVLTLLVALPNVFYGMYGMNVALPFAQEPWVYGAIVAFTIAVVILVLVIARKKGIF